MIVLPEQVMVFINKAKVFRRVFIDVNDLLDHKIVHEKIANSLLDR